MLQAQVVVLPTKPGRRLRLIERLDEILANIIELAMP
jgi:hypothetical protein